MAGMTFYVVEEYDPTQEPGKRTRLLTDPDSFLSAKDTAQDLRRKEKAAGGRKQYTVIKTSY
ncbi:hypothetical protein DNI29_19015 [Hymenobacter sediminis]|uniref:hypothetical protein n=1 Tax=Hymenobacter sediminis TaxID=2218621 RepID=UPI000DA685AF|nr:hypothetical protein [Hymenobacter sediminis]RPD45473.1 hypothetical protein DNI29_19015 [Hymenobacter sediminis]